MNKIEQIEKKAQSFLIQVKEKVILIENDGQCTEATEYLKVNKQFLDEIDLTFDPIVQKAHQAHKEAIAQKKQKAAPFLEVEFYLKKLVGQYLTNKKAAERREL